MRNDLATIAGIELAETLATFASDLGEAVMFMAERDLTLAHLTDADEQELIRILTVAGLIAETILRIYTEESVSSLFIE